MKLLLLTMTVLFIGCNEKQAEIPFEDKMKHKCVTKLKYDLIDPDSYQSIEWQIKTNNREMHEDLVKTFPDYKMKWYKWTYIHNYRAKNGFGGYTTGKIFFLVDSTGNNIEKMYEMPGYINQ